jgi:hypothetical protein
MTQWARRPVCHPLLAYATLLAIKSGVMGDRRDVCPTAYKYMFHGTSCNYPSLA